MKKLNLKTIAEMSDDEVYSLSMIRPQEPLNRDCRGFMFSLQTFESQEEMAECMCVLMNRLSKINKQ